MIISRAHRFVFFHNPKVGGTSVRATLEPFNDIGFGLWGLRDEVGPDMAHLGVDQFAAEFPELWDEVRGFRMFCLWRPPVARFLSAVYEHSLAYADIDIRFADAAARRDFLMRKIDELAALGTDEALLDRLEYTHLKPQRIYWTCADPAVQVTRRPLSDINAMFDEIEGLTGAPLARQRRNELDRLDLPGPMARLLSSARIKKTLRALPGREVAKTMLRRKYAAAPGPHFPLSDAENDRVTDFVKYFYDKDVELIGLD